MKACNDVLVIQPLPGIGDMIWHLPFLAAIAATAPDGRIDILARPRSRADQLLSAVVHVNEVLWLERDNGEHEGLHGLLRLSRQLRARSYREAWILHNSARYALLTRLAGVPEVIGYGVGAQRLFQTRHAAFSHAEAKGHPIDKAALCLHRLGISVADALPHLPVAADAAARMHERFAALPRPWIAVGIGSSEPFKQWGADRFADLCARIARAGLGSTILVGGSGEQPLADNIIVRSGVAVHSALDLSVRDIAALLAQCAAYVGNDTGFLNLAAATGIPAIGLFGGSPPLAHDDRIHCLLPEDGSRPWYGAPFMNRIGVNAVMAVLNAYLEETG